METPTYVKVKLLRTKDKTCATLKAFIERAEVETGERVNYFRSDSGGEYGSKVLATYFESKGIHHEKTNAYTPQENGLAERTNRTIVEMARLLLKDANLPNSYWSFAVNYAVHIINRSPTRTLKNSLTPFEAYTGNKPSIAHLCIFGCKAYAHVPQEKCQKLDSKTIECTYLGYSEHKKAYTLIHRSSGRLVESRDVYFDEGKLVEPSRVRIETEVSQNEAEIEEIHTDEVDESKTDSDSSVDLQELLDVKSDDDDDGDDPKGPPKHSGGSGNTGHAASPTSKVDNNSNRSSRSGHQFRATLTSPSDSATRKTSETSSTHLNGSNTPLANPYQHPSTQVIEPCRSTRNRRAPVRDDDNRYFLTSYGNHTGQIVGGGGDVEGGAAGDNEADRRTANVTQVTDVTDKSARAAVLGDPLTYHDATSREDHNEWIMAFNAELEVLKKFGVFEEVPRPKDRKIVGSKWVFRMKHGPNGQIE
jgi:hypothetical protein